MKSPVPTTCSISAIVGQTASNWIRQGQGKTETNLIAMKIITQFIIIAAPLHGSFSITANGSCSPIATFRRARIDQGEKPAKINGNVRIGTLLAQLRFQDGCPLDHDLSKRPSQKTGKQGNSREKSPQKSVGTSALVLFMHSRDSRTAGHWTMICLRGPHRGQENRRTRTPERKLSPHEPAATCETGSWLEKLRQDCRSRTYNLRGLGKKQSTIRNYLSNHTGMSFAIEHGLRSTYNLKTRRKGYERIQLDWSSKLSSRRGLDVFPEIPPEEQNRNCV